MRVYLAAPYAARASARAWANVLNTLDIGCTSSWLDEEHEINADTLGAAVALDDYEVSAHAQQDLEDIRDCDVLVLITAAYAGLDPALNHSGGRHVETGAALAMGKYVIVVGEAENVFHRITSGVVEVVGSWHGAIFALQQWQIRTLRDQLLAASR